MGKKHQVLVREMGCLSEIGIHACEHSLRYGQVSTNKFKEATIILREPGFKL